MLGIKELKDSIEVTEKAVECPVKACVKKVERQRSIFRREDRFKCQRHDIYISPSTFEYQNELDNLLWKDECDLNLLHRIKAVKRESRFARDNSEDAVTWNIFRFLEKNNMLRCFFEKRLKTIVEEPEIIYWSYSQSQDGFWCMLEKVRDIFELFPSKGSEPDLIIICRNLLIIIEVKLKASNKNSPSNLCVERKYTSGGQGWWNEVFCSDFKRVAVIEEKYELSRFWLIRTWIAEQLNLGFYLVNLVLSEQEKDIELIFKRHINENDRRRFVRITWEDIYKHIINSSPLSKDEDIALYFKNKSIGYKNGRLQRAFSILCEI